MELTRFTLSEPVKKYIDTFKKLYLGKNSTIQTVLTQQKKNIADRYPIPLALRSKVKKGFLLDVGFETELEKFQKKLKEFAQRVQQLPYPQPHHININQIGKLPLLNIPDEILQKKVNQLFTLDVSVNPGLSIKDVMAKQMVEDALEQKTLTLRTIIVEGTSGNTGAGLALMAIHYGMKIILIIPNKMSTEKINRLADLGANVIITPTNVSPYDPKSYYSVRDFMTKLVNGWASQQYDNLSNTKAHETITGPMIWEQTKGKITAVVATVGTGGTLSGIAHFLRKKKSDIKIIGVDPIGSIIYLLKEGKTLQEVQKLAHGYTIQGFGEDIHPRNLDLNVIDHIIRISDMEGLNITRLLPSLGFYAGQSSGAAFAGLIKAIDQKLLDKNDNIVVIFPDTGITYQNDVYNVNWLKEKGFYINI